MPSLNVVKFNLENFVIEDNLAVIDRLEKLLEEAKSGKYVSIAAIMLGTDHCAIHSWHSGGNSYVMLGALDILKRDFMDKCIESQE